MSEWTWHTRWQTLIAGLHVVSDPLAEQRLLTSLSTPDTPTVLGFVNAHALNLVVADTDYCKALAAADVLLRDGSGMALLYRRLGLEPGLNMNGTDFIPKLLAAFRGRRVAFWGTQEPFLSQAVRCCEARFGVQTVSLQHGFAEVDTYLELAQRLLPDLIVLGMGMPKQEVVAARLAASGRPCLIVCGGAILDFLGGKVNRAPPWLRRLGGEWAYRLLREPKRLFKRYVIGNPLFLIRTLRYAKVSADDARNTSQRS
ncbi:exopolysaccharide biosynthesis WecB/TagA/CpsF family protein [Pseudomonas hunanensis]|uniref:Exopolysaccharide biosynthesis WecB/TagA/CpsF family protein n=1 Tax=Pseudomonas hunanensis TaxID=1247546 RepID=A0ACC6JYU5_9PSED|nr:WecB/TagA/CpsF family glycosyltransferase [Pseudomonas hunanensis]MDR6711364.1 exopolysaccharide biosynthesis WecB/TagA/CpsF family protein [Pseudomonas hunanensis]